VETTRPSGWRPPAQLTKDIDFFVFRSKTNNLPVYTEFRCGRQRKFTIIRKVEGDLQVEVEIQLMSVTVTVQSEMKT
jgi:hypothetical protein